MAVESSRASSGIKAALRESADDLVNDEVEPKAAFCALSTQVRGTPPQNVVAGTHSGRNIVKPFLIKLSLRGFAQSGGTFFLSFWSARCFELNPGSCSHLLCRTSPQKRVCLSPFFWSPNPTVPRLRSVLSRRLWTGADKASGQRSRPEPISGASVGARKSRCPRALDYHHQDAGRRPWIQDLLCGLAKG